MRLSVLGRATLLVALGASTGCAVTVPVGASSLVMRPYIAAASPADVFGSQASVQVGQLVFNGELVACDAEHLYMYLFVTGMNPHARIPWRFISDATVLVSPPTTGRTTGFALWTAFGALASISHGWWGMFSAPVFLGASIPLTVSASRGSRVSGPCTEVRPYARYPQGLPAAVEGRYELHPIPP